MAVIHVLSEHLVNQIAAGEVIERPASVVKELLENAVDAQASRLVLELEEAGKKLIRLSDDGAGLAPDDVALALVGHATSKIASADDLEGITTLGFRGEALASIASVADVRLVSRTADALEATEVSVSGGKVEAARPTSGPVGTTVEVRNLFRYVPARRKFLKTDATEMGHITEQAARLALAYPAVHLTVTHNGRSVYELPPTDSVRERVAAFLGADVAEPLVEVASDEPAGRLWGLVGPPHLARATTAAQYLFINGRFVRDRGLLHALREAYRGLLEGYRQPVAFLFLTVPPERVDVNVHPTKIEVRLRDAHLLYGQVLGTIREKLLGSGHTPRLAAPGPAGGVAGGSMPGAAADGGATSQDAAGRHERIRQAMADFLRSPPSAAQQRLPLGGRAQGATSPGGPAWPVAQGGFPGGGAPASGAAAPGAMDAPPAPSPAQGLPQAAAGAEGAANAEGTANGGGAALLPPGHAIQIHNTYLVAETADGILIVDQHALHERVLFEEIMRRLEAGPLESQRRLVPVTVSLSDGEMAAVEEHREALAYLGIDAAPLGPRDVGIQAFPMLLERADPEATLRDFLAWAVSVDAPPSPRQVLERLAHVAACRAAVKAGDALKAEEIEALLAHREAAGLAPTCPHGRPTALVLRREDLEKQFGRDYAAGGRAPVGDEALPF
ncbi:MAG: DNA mismatch repair endonuclease MutL [Planctomycetes bacterium]|nr:DNA mismatch repair endonuclease MutL [Planctomycetota bacterium]